jgi:hypothetical protein
MVSAAIDYGYEKELCFNLARFEPEKARLNANNYSLFALESGMGKEEYERSSRGTSIISLNCKDKYANCYNLAKSCCH